MSQEEGPSGASPKEGACLGGSKQARESRAAGTRGGRAVGDAGKATCGQRVTSLGSHCEDSGFYSRERRQ